MNIVKGEIVRGDILLLTGVLLLILCSESAFCDTSLNPGWFASGSGIITIGVSSTDFTGSSGVLMLNGDVSEIKTNGAGNHNIKLGNDTEGNGAAIITAGHTINSITLDYADLDAPAGTLTIYGGDDATAVGVVTITGTISTHSAGLKILATGDATSGAISVGGAIYSYSSGAGGDVTVSTTGGAINVGGVINSYGDSGSGGNVTVSTTGSGAISAGDIDSHSYSNNDAGGNVTVSTTGSGAISVDNIDSSSYSNGGAGGNVTVSTTGTGSGAISVDNIDSSSYSNGGAGGNVTVSTTGSGAISVGNIDSHSFSGNGGAVKVLAENGKITSLGYILINNGTVTIEAGELAGDIGTIGDFYDKSGQVDITIGSVTSGTIGDITTNGANVNITAGNGLTLGNSINAGSGSINLTANNGTFTLSGATTCSALNIAVSKGAIFKNTGSVIDLSGDKGSLTLDFGDASATSAYAQTKGAFKSSGTTEVTSIYGINGFAGRTYAEVFDTPVVYETGIAGTDTAYADGIELNNTKDTYRKYILANNGRDIIVKNNNSIRQDIIDLGGSQEAADAANNLIDNQGNFDSEGQEFVDQFTALSGHNLLRGSRELIGEEATDAAIQSGLQGVTAATGSVRSQMAEFRMGSLASGLASSFSSAGSTAATSDMADADELSAAYEAADSSFTTDNTVYRQTTVWANAFGGFGEQGTKGDATGYDFWNAGTMVGLDYAFAEELRVGGLLGYSYNRANLYEDSGDSTDNVLRLGGYASYNWDNFFVDISPSMGIHIIESNRKLITNGLTAKGERTGLDFNINGSIGYTFNLPYDIDFTPSYSLGYTLFYDPDYTETGAGAGNLSYKSFNSNSLLQDTGVKFGKLFRVSEKLAFLPEVWGGLEVEYLNTGGNRSSTTSTSIGGSSYSTSVSSLETYRGYWGAGITALVNDNVSVFGRYDHKIWHKGYNAGFSAGIKIAF